MSVSDTITLTPKREKFAQGVAEGKSQADAYRSAFSTNAKPSVVQSEASRLMGNHKVASRVEELRAPIVEKVRMTLEPHLSDLKELRDIAKQNGQIGAAITAEIARGKASGVHVEKSEQTVTTKTLPSSVDEFV